MLIQNIYSGCSVFNLRDLSIAVKLLELLKIHPANDIN